MKYLNRILYVIILPLLAISCRDSLGIDDVKIVPEDALILPLKVGNEWTYHITQYNDSGVVINQYDLKYVIISEKVINGETWYVQDQGSQPPGVTATMTNRKDGLWYEKGTSEFSKDMPYLVVSYPATLGKEYLVSRYTNSFDKKIYTVFRSAESVNWKLTVPAGNFYCLKYVDKLRLEDGSLVQEPLNVIYYAPNRGLIKRERYSAGENDLFISEMWELKNFVVK